MLIHVKCPACGEAAKILVDVLADLPPCPVCGEVFGIVSLAPQGAPVGAEDDEILSWLAVSAEPSEPTATDDAVCQACGYAGLMDFNAERGCSFCPACFDIYRPPIARPVATSSCPECGADIALTELDRGKTVLCPRCKYFLGCLLPNHPRHPGAYKLFGQRP